MRIPKQCKLSFLQKNAKICLFLNPSQHLPRRIFEQVADTKPLESLNES